MANKKNLYNPVKSLNLIFHLYEFGDVNKCWGFQDLKQLFATWTQHFEESKFCDHKRLQIYLMRVQKSFHPGYGYVYDHDDDDDDDATADVEILITKG